MSDEFEMFDQPDDFLPGSVGEPGNRVFYMQARDGHRVTSLRCEKEQVLALAQFLMRLVGDDGPVEPLGELIEPVTESFVVGNLLVSAEDADQPTDTAHPGARRARARAAAARALRRRG